MKGSVTETEQHRMVGKVWGDGLHTCNVKAKERKRVREKDREKCCSKIDCLDFGGGGAFSEISEFSEHTVG